MAKVDIQCQAQGQPSACPSWVLDSGAKECDSLLPPEDGSWNSQSQWERMQNWVHSPALPLPMCVTLSTPSCPSEPYVIQLENRGSNTLFVVAEKMKQDEAG